MVMRSTKNLLRFTHTLAAAVGLAAIAGVSIATALNYTALPAPFFWLDVAVVYFLAALPLAASLSAIICRRHEGARGLLTAELIAVLLIPQLYIYARTQSDMARVMDLVQQSRYAEAAELSHCILRLAPQAALKNLPFAKVSQSIDATVVRLEASVARRLDSNAQRPERANQLAMLGRTKQALETLEASPSVFNYAEAHNLRGTIFENRREWREALRCYGFAKSAWHILANSPEKAAGMARAITGVAYCERKLGRLREAETAWLELLAIAPTAKSHFLLAQFYEDTQQTAKAKFHAEQAVKLNPEVREPANRLLNNLATSHFGCLGVFRPSEPLSR